MKPIKKEHFIRNVFTFVLLCGLILIGCTKENGIEITEDVDLSTQAEVNAFSKRNVERLLGNLTIGGSIDDISSLNELTYVSGHLAIYGSSLEDFTGLENLTTVDHLNITNNKFLISFAGLDNVKISSRLIIRNNTILTTLLGLSSNVSYQENEVIDIIEIIENDKLINIDGITNLRVIGSIKITDNPSLQNLDGLRGLEETQDYIEIEDNVSLENIDGLKSLERIGSDLFLKLGSSVNNIKGLSSLNSIEDQFELKFVALNSLEGLEGLETINNSFVLDGSLGSLQGLNNLKRINGRLYLTYLNLIEDLDALENLTFVQNLNIVGCAKLKNIDGLSNLKTIEEEDAGDLHILKNPSLTNINGLVNLTSYSGNLWISENDELLSFEGLENAVNVKGEFSLIQISKNKKITSLMGLNSLADFSYFSVFQNPLLNDLCGFENKLSNVQGENYYVSSNGFNPTLDDLKNGICSN